MTYHFNLRDMYSYKGEFLADGYRYKIEFSDPRWDLQTMNQRDIVNGIMSNKYNVPVNEIKWFFLNKL
ncbi:MAG: hypothetical protein SLAVMIC_01030 [uncultured marine phage]|uniref:Uncharacterized protein n=1 Tax=uncultured marine phage TaxID=707152 RepID=A0A8D9FRA4_9VIRU|nr:MAG: hypothetical protein SLAVMIC_01030 [uncultured marine phage]